MADRDAKLICITVYNVLSELKHRFILQVAFGDWVGMRANLILIASASEMSGLRMMKHLPSWEMPA